MGRQGIEPYNNARIACLSPRIVANLTAGDALRMKKINIIVNAKVINVLLIIKRFALNYAKYYRLKKLHTSLYVCKNKIAHRE